MSMEGENERGEARAGRGRRKRMRWCRGEHGMGVRKSRTRRSEAKWVTMMTGVERTRP